MIFKITNFILFQAAWFICVLGAAYDLTYPALGISMLILTVHFALIKK